MSQRQQRGEAGSEGLTAAEPFSALLPQHPCCPEQLPQIGATPKFATEPARELPRQSSEKMIKQVCPDIGVPSKILRWTYCLVLYYCTNKVHNLLRHSRPSI